MIKKGIFVVVVITAVIVSLFVWAQMGGKKTTGEKPASEKTVAAVDSEIDNTDEWEEDDEDSISDFRGLNDIRFANFEEKDWLDNEYIRTLRRYLDAFNSGQIEDEELQPYRSIVQGKFVIYNTQPFIGGGLYIQISFIDHPERLFSAWVYSDVNAEEIVTSYHVQSIFVEEEKIDVTKEELLKIISESPELKLW